jgi:hypothetical protein
MVSGNAIYSKQRQEKLLAFCLSLMYNLNLHMSAMHFFLTLLVTEVICDCTFNKLKFFITRLKLRKFGVSAFNVSKKKCCWMKSMYRKSLTI